MAHIGVGEQGGLDERFRATDPVVRPFAVETGYEEWGDQAGLLDSVVWEDLYDHQLAGNITEAETRTAAVETPKLIRVACELGYISRLHSESLVVDFRLGDNLSAVILGETYRSQQGELLNEVHSAALRSTGPDSTDWSHRLALGELLGVRPRVTMQAFLWGRLGSQLFLRGESSDTPSTVIHHGGLVTTDAVRETAVIDKHMKEFEIDDPSYGLLEKLAVWREGSQFYREHFIPSSRRNLTRYKMGRWLREGTARAEVRQAERVRFQEELRANPVDIS